MLKQTYIKATFTPTKTSRDEGTQPDPENAESVTIVAFDGSVAIFTDKMGRLRRGNLNQFSECVFVTF